MISFPTFWWSEHLNFVRSVNFRFGILHLYDFPLLWKRLPLVGALERHPWDVLQRQEWDLVYFIGSPSVVCKNFIPLVLMSLGSFMRSMFASTFTNRTFLCERWSRTMMRLDSQLITRYVAAFCHNKTITPSMLSVTVISRTWRSERSSPRNLPRLNVGSTDNTVFTLVTANVM